MALKLNSRILARFLSYMKLTNEELSFFRGISAETDLVIQYYYEGDEDAYSEENKIKVYNFYYKKDRR